ncbi:uncharacterized protein [Nicotiana tomentosiformis]|uniref:uncharacterized protein n=1 Tax=Nicotiana tomentosiformis TaxID=4098 RepID=UPI00388C9F8D
MNKIDMYMPFLGFQHCVPNTNGQIWFLWSGNYQIGVIDNNVQQLTIKIHYNHANYDIYLTVFYAKCTATERRDLWSNLENIHTQIKGPWYIRGDFNIILDPDEKKGGNPHRMHRSFEFSSCMDNCEVADFGFVSPKFTWYNNWKARKRIWKKLDRVFVNDLWSQIFQSNMVRHLARTGSDHRPLLIKCQKYLQACIKYFKFLDFWAE